jgi:TPR repeat protein
MIELFGRNGNSLAASQLDLKKAIGQGDVKARRAALEAASRNNVAAAIGFALICLVPSKSDCAAESVDALLPWAEKSYAMTLVALALAFEHGRGVKRNEDNVRALLQKADQRLGDSRGSLMFAYLSTVVSKDISPVVRKTVEKLADQHQPSAELLLAAVAAKQTGDNLNAPTVTMLHDAAAAGLSSAQYLLGSYLIKHGQPRDGVRWIEIAAIANDRDAQKHLAGAYERGDNVDKDSDLARKWYAEAGQGGEVSAMLWMADYYSALPPSASSHKGEEGWLESAMDSGNIDAAMRLAALYENDEAGAVGGPQAAAAIYRALDTNYNNAEARRRLANMLLHSASIEHNSVEARRLLALDADRGDMRSRVELGMLMTQGVWGADQVNDGMRMLEKGAQEGDSGAMVELGMALYYADPPQRERGLAYFQQAADKSNSTGANNLAWVLCTSPDAQILDARKGLEIAHKIADGVNAPLGYVDTLAACYAAEGDFEQAERVERDGLKRAQAMRPVPEHFVKLASSRIDLFSQHKTFVDVK